MDCFQIFFIKKKRKIVGKFWFRFVRHVTSVLNYKKTKINFVSKVLKKTYKNWKSFLDKLLNRANR